MSPADLPERLAKRVAVDASGCWNWTGALNQGYGSTYHKGRVVRAHRLAYHLLVDDSLVVSPGRFSGSVIDHLCRNRACVNPAHMEPTTARTNVGRGTLARPTTSEYIGVHAPAHLAHSSRRFVAMIRLNGPKVYLGCFATELEAARAYDAACIAHGLAPLNATHGLIEAAA